MLVKYGRTRQKKSKNEKKHEKNKKPAGFMKKTVFVVQMGAIPLVS
jgi:hypothetical protein